MSVPALYYPHAIVLPSSTVISQLSDLGPGYELDDLSEFAAGQVGPQFVGSGKSMPQVSFSSTQLSSLLAEIDTLGVCKSLAAGNTDVYYRKGASLGARVAAASSAHIRLRMASNGLLAWQSIQCDQDRTAEIRARILPVWDGTNNPLVITGSTALAGASAVNSIYTLGPIKINGSFVGGLTTLSWENNLEYEEVGSDGEEFISYGGIRSVRPVITFRTKNAEVLSTFGAKGTAVTALSCFFRKRQSAGINVADNTAEHISLTHTAGVVKAQRISNAEAEVQVHLRQAAENAACFTINVGVVIS
jgi:hypothetical protein